MPARPPPPRWRRLPRRPGGRPAVARPYRAPARVCVAPCPLISLPHPCFLARSAASHPPLLSPPLIPCPAAQRRAPPRTEHLSHLTELPVRPPVWVHTQHVCDMRQEGGLKCASSGGWGPARDSASAAQALGGHPGWRSLQQSQCELLLSSALQAAGLDLQVSGCETEGGCLLSCRVGGLGLLHRASTRSLHHCPALQAPPRRPWVQPRPPRHPQACAPPPPPPLGEQSARCRLTARRPVRTPARNQTAFQPPETKHVCTRGALLRGTARP